ncbi:MAG: hypothetical protein M9920_01710 [Verrucomicrobiae bacterium]|nr:hypothetical protein [Verrucomicrobiae bacterium]
MKQQTKHTAHEQEPIAETESQSASVREFASAEELLRHDARQITVPPQIAERLARSIQNEPKPASPWWRRLLGS